MAGSATLTTELSMKAMLEPRIVAASTQGLERSGQTASVIRGEFTPE